MNREALINKIEKLLNLAGNNPNEAEAKAAMAKAQKLIAEYNIDTSHFRGQGWNVGLKFKPTHAKSLSEILVNGSSFQSYKLKNRLFKECLKEKRCENCGRTTWLGHEIPLEIHHKNGDSRDNRLENLEILCPNCHALTDSYRGKNNKSATGETL